MKALRDSSPGRITVSNKDSRKGARDVHFSACPPPGVIVELDMQSS